VAVKSHATGRKGDARSIWRQSGGGRALVVLPFALLIAASPAEQTRISSARDAQRLLSSKGVTLQWIDWNTRGSVKIVRGAPWRLTAAQAEAGGSGRLFMDGSVTEIGKGYFTFRGIIRISDTPDPGRKCEANKDWHFAITQNRSYYRLREFEWCDQLTDYVDIHF
jgi:hypothetical protein